MSKCYCGRELPFLECCHRVHNNITLANTAEDLMRSRYTAFVIAKGDYLMKSHHADTRPIKEKKAIVSWAKSVQWIKLEVINVCNGGVLDTHGTVEFKAFFYENGHLEVIHEDSKFLRENGYWVYYGVV